MLFRGKPEYNKKGKLNYKIDLVEFTLYEVFDALRRDNMSLVGGGEKLFHKKASMI